MLDRTLIKGIQSEIPKAAISQGMKKPEMIEAIFRACFDILFSKKHAPKKSQARKKATTVSHDLTNNFCLQKSGRYFWPEESN
jgi:hypothetical protein